MSLVIILALIIVVGVAIWVSRNRSLGTPVNPIEPQSRPPVGTDLGRLVLYGVSLIGLMGFLFALSGLINIVMSQTIFASHNLMGEQDARTQVSYLLAALIVATPLWLGFWHLVQRRVDRSPEERDAPERRLYFALTFAVTSVVSLFALSTVLHVLFTLPGAESGDTALRDGGSAFIRLAVYGAAWLHYTRLAWRERPSAEADAARDLALYVLTGFSLIFLAIGGVNLLSGLLDHLIQGQQDVLLGGSSNSLWDTLGSAAALIVSGGAVWAAVTYHDRIYPGVRAFRVSFLYLALIVAGVFTIGSGTDLLDELLRRLFGYRPDVVWGYLRDPLPPTLVAGAIWSFYWVVIKRQAQLSGRETEPGAIPWPRRPYLALVTLAGLALSVAGAVAIVWVGLDFVFGTHDSLTDSAWWRDQLSLGVSLLAVGGAVWLPPWRSLEIAAEHNVRERGAQARRVLLGAVVLISSLACVGFLVAFLWLVLGEILGASQGTDAALNMVRFLTAAVMTGGVATYHILILRGDLKAGAGRGARVHVTALITPDAADAIAAISKQLEHDIEIVGYLTAGSVDGGLPLDALDEALETAAGAGASRALLILGPDSALVYPYSRSHPTPVTKPGGQTGIRPLPTAP